MVLLLHWTCMCEYMINVLTRMHNHTDRYTGADPGGPRGPLPPTPPHKKKLPQIVRRGSRGAKRALAPPYKILDPPMIYLYTHPSILPSSHQSYHPSSHLFIHPAIHPSILPFILPPNHSSIQVIDMDAN